jgi:hypothetical protein
MAAVGAVVRPTAKTGHKVAALFLIERLIERPQCARSFDTQERLTRNVRAVAAK